MEKRTAPRFFLGANSPGGFYSLYSGFTDCEAGHLYILKGGPGCGKSTLMKSIGAACEDAGLEVEYIHCSGDPDSLDGLLIPSRGVAYVDGTSPHVIEPVFAGSQASYVNMGAFYDLAALAERREDIAALTRKYKAHYARAFRLLTAASCIIPSGALPEASLLTAARRARGIISRELRGHGGGTSAKRFLSAWTCKGYMCLWDTVPALADKIYLLDNELGMAGLVIEAAASSAEERGIDVIRCQSPMCPDRTEHVIFPGLRLAILSQSTACPYTGDVSRHVRLDSVPPREVASALRSEARRVGRIREPVLTEAVSELRAAKESHDRLEECYIPNVDFAGIDRLTQRHIEALELDTFS